MILNNRSLHQVRNDYNNNFNGINTVNFIGFSKIVSARFCKLTKYLTFLTNDLRLHQMKNFEAKLSKVFSFKFSKSKDQLIEGIVVDYQFCSELELIFLLNSNK